MTAAARPTTMAHLDAGAVEYRLAHGRKPAVVVFHGGHMRAGLALGEDVFVSAGHTVLVPSRPGYGRTPIGTGTSAAGFAGVVEELCRHLEIEQAAAVVGISGGGPAAMTMAARHPRLVQRLILQSAVGFLPWPGRATRLGANLVFAPAAERVTWAGVRTLMRVAPTIGLRSLLRSLSTEPVGEVMAALGDEHRATLIALFSQMRSGRGFINDLRSTRDVTCEITQPTLVVASPRDGAVPFTHAESLAARINGAELVPSQANSHFIWFGDDYPAVADTIRTFLTDAAG
jgi:pimeloyl-ACP methyl ester carboxylesterase